ncbi:YdeI/OmpD-associated family protein [Sphingopyxis sp.]|jgi:hypothetical protein|uniref:YdeI/OmpD-associated family protein n=1 Tax=Sphingopyxis sp. TaxID=1908224 RepID=UPI003F706F33
MKFKAKIERKGINPYVRVSAARAQRIKAGWKKPLPVLVRVNEKPVDGAPVNMMPAGDGGFFLYLDSRVRAASETEVGDLVDVWIVFDRSYRPGPQHPMPFEFASRLDSNPRAKMCWDGLTPSLQKEILRYLASLKSDAARQRNLERAIEVLSGAKARFLAREWN